MAAVAISLCLMRLLLTDFYGIYAILVINDLICILKFSHICFRSYSYTI